jgi:hypothetical protein
MRELKPHMGRRLRGWDYRRPGSYMITLVMADRREGKFGELVVKRTTTSAECAELWLSIDEARALGLEPEQVEAKVIFSSLGRAIFEHFKKMGAFTPGLEPVYCAVMPDHLHLLVKIVRELARPLGNAIGGFKTGCEKIYQRAGGEGRLFAEGFVDEIILRAGQLKAEFAYLLDNPRRLAVKRLFPWLFKVSRRIRVDFRLAPKAPAGQWATPTGQAVQVGQGAGREGDVWHAPAALAAGWFSAIGNHFLLARYRVITLANKGFSPLYKPGGKLFESCAAGNLLMLAPAQWPYQPAEKPMTRVDALVLNRIAQLIAGEGACEIDYKGVTLANVDAEVKKVV